MMSAARCELDSNQEFFVVYIDGHGRWQEEMWQREGNFVRKSNSELAIAYRSFLLFRK